MTRLLLVAVAVVVALAVSAGCTGDSASPEDTGPREDGCARLVSAIGYAEPVLPSVPVEEALPSDVRGRLAYVTGTVTQFGEVVPPAARDAARELQAAADELTSADVPVGELDARLERYRSAVHAVQTVCGTG